MASVSGLILFAGRSLITMGAARWAFGSGALLMAIVPLGWSNATSSPVFANMRASASWSEYVPLSAGVFTPFTSWAGNTICWPACLAICFSATAASPAATSKFCFVSAAQTSEPRAMAKAKASNVRAPESRIGGLGCTAVVEWGIWWLGSYPRRKRSRIYVEQFREKCRGAAGGASPSWRRELKGGSMEGRLPGARCVRSPSGGWKPPLLEFGF